MKQSWSFTLFIIDDFRTPGIRDFDGGQRYITFGFDFINSGDFVGLRAELVPSVLHVPLLCQSAANGESDHVGILEVAGDHVNLLSLLDPLQQFDSRVVVSF